jgi:hypothetical protein
MATLEPSCRGGGEQRGDEEAPHGGACGAGAGQVGATAAHLDEVEYQVGQAQHLNLLPAGATEKDGERQNDPICPLSHSNKPATACRRAHSLYLRVHMRLNRLHDGVVPERLSALLLSRLPAVSSHLTALVTNQS